MFYDILERKNASTDFIKKKLKKSKNWDFFHCFGQKLTIFPCFFFGAKRAKEIRFTIF